MSDNILTSERGLAMLGYCPQYYESSRLFQSYLQTSGTEMDDFRTAMDEVLDQFFVNTATWGLDKWESELGLTSFAGKPEDQRRSRIVSKLRGMGTVTVALMQSVAKSYTNGEIQVTEHPETYSFTVKFVDQLGVPPNLNDLKQAIEEIKPAHLAVVYEYKYLLINQIHRVMTISEMESHPLTDFAPFVPV
jgi:uncharacterized protein YmfQ (DUF2313 family)